MPEQEIQKIVVQTLLEFEKLTQLYCKGLKPREVCNAPAVRQALALPARSDYVHMSMARAARMQKSSNEFFDFENTLARAAGF